MPDGFAYLAPYMLTPGQPTPGLTYPPASPHCYPPAPGPGSSEDSPRQHTIGVGADTVVQEYQPVVHRLRLAASP
jgi:hypothetical protein